MYQDNSAQYSQQPVQQAKEQSYSIKKNLPRKIIPKTFEIFLLSIVFYAGVALNLSLLKMKMPKEISNLIILIISLLVVIEILINYLKQSGAKYVFYPSRIENIKGQKLESTIYYTQITNISLKRSAVDKIFNTGDIILSPGMKLEGIKDPQRIYLYIKELIRRASQYSYS